MGEFTPEFNNFTFVSPRGRSVPDYLFSPIENLTNCHTLKTLLISDIINDFKITPPPSIPDHSVLSATFITSHFNYLKQLQQQEHNVLADPGSKISTTRPAKKNLRKITDRFMMTEDIVSKVNQTIIQLEKQLRSKDQINALWGEIKNICMSEIKSLPDLRLSISNKNNRKVKKAKSFWNPELESLWSYSCKMEKTYVNFKAHSRTEHQRKNVLRLEFKNAQSRFDKSYRYYKRLYEKKQ